MHSQATVERNLVIHSIQWRQLLLTYASTVHSHIEWTVLLSSNLDYVTDIIRRGHLHKTMSKDSMEEVMEEVEKVEEEEVVNSMVSRWRQFKQSCCHQTEYMGVHTTAIVWCGWRYGVCQSRRYNNDGMF